MSQTGSASHHSDPQTGQRMSREGGKNGVRARTRALRDRKQEAVNSDHSTGSTKGVWIRLGPRPRSA